MRCVYLPFHTLRLRVMLRYNPLVLLAIDTPVMLSCSRSVHTPQAGPNVSGFFCFFVWQQGAVSDICLSVRSQWVQEQTDPLPIPLTHTSFPHNHSRVIPQWRFASYVRLCRPAATQHSCHHHFVPTRNVNLLQWAFLSKILNCFSFWATETPLVFERQSVVY